MVRRCVHRATGQEFAVKIMEVTAERLSPEQLEEVREATRRLQRGADPQECGSQGTEGHWI